FVKGKLVMLSRKNVASGSIPYFKVAPPIKEENRGFVQPNIAGYLERGVPIFLVETPELISREDIPPASRPPVLIFLIPPASRPPVSRSWTARGGDKKFWKVKFLMNEQIYQMFMTNRQYNHELVKAVPRRLTKDYSREAAQTRS